MSLDLPTSPILSLTLPDWPLRYLGKLLMEIRKNPNGVRGRARGKRPTSTRSWMSLLTGTSKTGRSSLRIITENWKESSKKLKLTHSSQLKPGIKHGILRMICNWILQLRRNLQILSSVLLAKAGAKSWMLRTSEKTLKRKRRKLLKNAKRLPRNRDKTRKTFSKELSLNHSLKQMN